MTEASTAGLSTAHVTARPVVDVVPTQNADLIALGDPRAPRRFWDKVAQNESGCWEWLGCRLPNGYGKFGAPGKTWLAHRFAFIHLRHRTDAPIDHLCRNRACVNPGHMQPVTLAQNNRRASRTKLSPEDVNTIRAEYADGQSQSDLARRFGVCPSHVSRVVRNEKWIP